MNHKQAALNAFIGIRRTSDQLLKLAKKDANRYNLNINEFAVLELLLHKGPSTVQTITEKILIANSSTTYIIDQLCLKELVYRESAPHDRRVCIVHLTDEGEKLISSIFPCHADMIDKAFTELDTDEIRQLISLLKRIQ